MPVLVNLEEEKVRHKYTARRSSPPLSTELRRTHAFSPTNTCLDTSCTGRPKKSEPPTRLKAIGGTAGMSSHIIPLLTCY